MLCAVPFPLGPGLEFRAHCQELGRQRTTRQFCGSRYVQMSPLFCSRPWVRDDPFSPFKGKPSQQATNLWCQRETKHPHQFHTLVHVSLCSLSDWSSDIYDHDAKMGSVWWALSSSQLHVRSWFFTSVHARYSCGTHLGQRSVRLN